MAKVISSATVNTTSLKNEPGKEAAIVLPPALTGLPDPQVSHGVCPKRARMQLDLMLLAIESLVIGGSEAILSAIRELELNEVIPHRVSLWQMRSTNPLRRFSQRRALKLTEGKALAAIAAHLAKRLVVVIRQLLVDAQQLQKKGIPFENHLRLSDYLDRFRTHFRYRMNPNRTAVLAYASDEKLNALAMDLLSQLLFCTGTYGLQRFWFSLFDGEVE